MKKLRIISILLILLLLISSVFLFIELMANQDVEEPTEITNNNYDFSNLYIKDGFLAYEDDNYYSSLGLDVSQYQGDIDFEKVKASGFEFVFIRIGVRGYYSGEIRKDTYFEKNYENATKCGLKVGVYFYSQAKNTHEVDEECKFLFKILKGRKLDLPVVCDYEDAESDIARTNNLSTKTKTNNVLRFLKNINKEGYKAMLYGNTNFLLDSYDLTKLQHYDLWLAHYNEQPSYPYEFCIWQYRDDGLVNGVNGHTDIDIMFIPK